MGGQSLFSPASILPSVVAKVCESKETGLDDLIVVVWGVGEAEGGRLVDTIAVVFGEGKV